MRSISKKVLKFSPFFLLFLQCFNSPATRNVKIQYTSKNNPAYLINVNSLMFPDSIFFRFVLGSEMDCDIKKGILKELVENDSDTLAFNLTIRHNSLPRKLWVVEDCSGSLSGKNQKADSVFIYLRSYVREDEDIGLIRFGQDAVKISGSKRQRISKKAFNLYPDPNGTNVLKTLNIILSEKNKNVSSTSLFLFSDGDFSYDFPTDSFLTVLTENNIRLFAVAVGSFRESMLEELSSRSGGFLVDGGKFSAKDLAMILHRGSMKHYTISYSPKRKSADSKIHEVSFELPCGQRLLFSYRAPYIEEKLALKPKGDIRPQNEPYIIPFFEPNNSILTPNGIITLDSVVSLINNIPQDRTVILRIDGYTCSLGDSIYNVELSKKRARNVELYLKERFKDKPNIEFVVNWHGKLNPRYRNDDESARALNRRVELRIFTKEGI